MLPRGWGADPCPMSRLDGIAVTPDRPGLAVGRSCVDTATVHARVRSRSVATLAVIVGLGLALSPARVRDVSAADPVHALPASPSALRPDGHLPLEGTPWRLLEYRRDGTMRMAGPEVAATISLHAGVIEGSGGCTGFKGGYATMGAAIRIRPGRAPGAGCAEQTVMVQEATLDGLRKAAMAEVQGTDDGDQLVLRNATGTELLRFRRDDVGPLEGVEWRLVAYQLGDVEVAADPTQSAVLSFHARSTRAARRESRGSIDGSSGCNGIVGTFTRHGDVIATAGLKLTDAPCPTALAAQESAILQVLGAHGLLAALDPDRLTLTDVETGTRLSYVSQTPLEGTPWLLTDLAGTELPTEPLTLSLAHGTFSGEGPCGPYSGSYLTDGLFLTFADVRGAGDDRCAEASAERAWLAVLRATVATDPTTARLRLWDARGRTIARFTAPLAP
jgi:heat shock protein HslJ